MGSPTKGLAGAVRKALSASAVAGGVFAAAAASAGPYGDSYHVWVDVLDVDPIVRVDHVDEPVERCFDAPPATRVDHRYQQARRSERQRDRHHDGRGAAVVGGLVGGLLGNRLGDGKGRESEFTIAGALLGATIAASANSNRYDRHDRYDRQVNRWRSEPVRRCEVTWESRAVERIDGYEVVYRYAGRRFTKIVDDHPGERMRVRVDLSPA